MLRRGNFHFLLLAVFVFLPTLALAQIYDPAAQFDPNNNPALNSPWRYGYTLTLGGTLTLYTVRGMYYGTDAWFHGNSYPNNYPDTFHNGTDHDIDYHGGTLKVGQLAIHAGPHGEYSLIRWTAPTTRDYDITATFTKNEQGRAEVHILYNSASLLDGSLTTNQQASFNLSAFHLSAGDTIDFAVGDYGGANFLGNTVVIAAKIKPVPLVITEPPYNWFTQ